MEDLIKVLILIKYIACTIVFCICFYFCAKLFYKTMRITFDDSYTIVESIQEFND